LGRNNSIHTSISHLQPAGAVWDRPQSSLRRRLPWFDILIAFIAMGAVTGSALYQVQFRNSTFAASDFKTLYASTWAYAHGQDAYSIPNLQKVFTSNGVIQPENWYGHAPVYPPFTLALLSPFAYIRMVPAIYLMTILSGLLMAIALALLMRYAAIYFGLGPAWRVLLAGLCAAGPLLSFGIDMGNVSLAALCVLAFVWRSRGPAIFRRFSPWIPATALAVAILLKPHLGLWSAVAMLLLPERAARAVVLRTLAICVGFGLVTVIAMAAMGTLSLQIHSYLAMLASETASGASMNATSRDVLPVVAQITSLGSIVGFWVANPGPRLALTAAGLLVLGLAAAWQTRRVDSERGALLAVGAWCALGMLVTYHRAHDAVLLLLVAPWVVDRLRRARLAAYALAAAALYCAMSTSADLPVVIRWVSSAGAHSLVAFALLRQVGLADLLLLLVLLVAMTREHAYREGIGTGLAEQEELPVAA
jgi:hypothetical protein